MTSEQVSAICKALGDPNRLQIIQILVNGESCACQLLETLHITQPTLSHHMKILEECSLVHVRREGKWTYYSIHCCVFKEFKSYFDNIICWKDKQPAVVNHCNCLGE